MKHFDEMADKIIKELGAVKADLVFGESREFEGKMVIPVSKVAYGWGGGGGKVETETKDKEQNEEEHENENTGVGMGVQVKPLGYITMTADSIYYKPIRDITPIFYIVSIFAGLALLSVLKPAKPSKLHMPMGKNVAHGMMGMRKKCGMCAPSWKKMKHWMK